MNRERERKTENRPRGGRAAQAALLVLLLAVLAFILVKSAGATPAAPATPTPGQGAETPTPTPAGMAETPAPTPEPTPEPTPFAPYATEGTDPALYLSETAVMVDGVLVEDYVPEAEISFGEGWAYTDVQGVTTFRGNNFRDGGTYGEAGLTEKSFGQTWNVATGSIMASGEYWSGNGWTGQPLVMTWPRETRAVMTNMYDWAREQETLTEVISAAMDGYIYFLELQTGKATRDKLYMGYPFKGAGSLDPRGYPILYVGSGYTSDYGASHVFVISLLDGSVLYEFGANDSFALRAWSMFDASPLVDAETDQLIYPGENGVLYLITLGTAYDEAAGTLSVSPTRTVKWRYNTFRHQQKGWYLGFEASPAVWQGHIFLPDNAGHLICLDLNSLEVKWVQDILDDSNSTPVLALEDGRPYIYVSTSFHYGWRAWDTAAVPIWKLDAQTGEAVWRTDYTCYTVDGVSGGVQGSPALGKQNLSDLIVYPVARTPNISAGLLVALDRETGEEVWRTQTNMYSWSSPLIVYDANGDGYVLYTTFGQYIYILDGRTGEELATMNLGGKMEASPVVYDNYVVVGTRDRGIYGIELR